MKRSMCFLLALVGALVGVTQAQKTYVLLSEDFEELTLGPKVDEAEAWDEVWTKTPPAGWTIDDTSVPGAGTVQDGVTEWAGWSFADRVWWTTVASDQTRSQFTKGVGTVAIADPDEWDDASHAAGRYNTYLSTPAIDVSNARAGTVELTFDSSWRPQFADYGEQSGNLKVSFDGAPAQQLFLWLSDTGSPKFKPDSQNETVTMKIDNPAGAKTMVLTFGLFNCGNNWWWAIDNVLVTAKWSGVRAFNPKPDNGAKEVPVKTVLSWAPGEYVGGQSPKHRVILSKDPNAVKNGTAVVAAQDANSLDATGRLDFGTTYYWRIDEANGVAGWNEGNVWSFTTEAIAYPVAGVTATASSAQPGMGPENTVNGSGMTGDLHGTEGTTMWLSTGTLPNWIQYQFGGIYKLHQLKVWNSNQLIEGFLGFGAKSVKIEYSTDGTTWMALANVPEFAKASGVPGYAANTTVDFGGVMAKYVKLTINSTWGGMSTVTSLSEVRFFYVPVQAREPKPADGATGVSVDTTLSWRAGREAGSHKVFFGTDRSAVAGGTATAQTVTGPAFNPGALLCGTTYYWRVDEVNAVTYPGSVWSFSTAPYSIVEDFESYNDADNCIFDTWIDGLTDGKSGSQVGYDTAPFAERTIVHGGTQSMPLKYDNTAKFAFSEATRTFATAQNWTTSGIKSLSLWFQGPAANTGGQLYLKINGTKVAYSGDAGSLAKGIWIPWNIDLSTVGTSVSKVTSLTIGIEGSGSKGILYVDDIRLYPKTPEYTTPVDPGKTNLAALWTLDGNANDTSGKGNNGTVNGTGTWVAGKTGQALQFNGTATYVDCGSGASLKLTDAVTITAWIKMDFTAGDRKIAGNQDGTTGGYKFGVYSNNLIEFEIRTAANAATLNRTSAGGTALQQGAWYHVAGVYSKGQFVRTYVYGNLDRELVTTALLGSSTGTFKLGREPFGAGGSYWLGALDEVQVYSKALSQEEILWLAGQTKPVAKPF